jgi:hypothetical protein
VWASRDHTTIIKKTRDALVSKLIAFLMIGMFTLVLTGCNDHDADDQPAATTSPGSGSGGSSLSSILSSLKIVVRTGRPARAWR